MHHDCMAKIKSHLCQRATQTDFEHIQSVVSSKAELIELDDSTEAKEFYLQT